jgi:hypothetical protein
MNKQVRLFDDAREEILKLRQTDNDIEADAILRRIG